MKWVKFGYRKRGPYRKWEESIWDDLNLYTGWMTSGNPNIKTNLMFEDPQKRSILSIIIWHLVAKLTNHEKDTLLIIVSRI